MIDHARIEELRAEIGSDDLSFIVTVYVDEARATLAQLRSGLPDEQCRRAVHFLRSGALNIGLRGIARLTAEMEDDLAAGRPLRQATCASDLDEMLDRTLGELGPVLA
ncbi:Hpt domain-containing protein [Jannaschia marina]|uniref:Hpt domain-containing protein n=1 Tax=Jannaschia marina TaxID=2741674 RepID=UPI0015CAD74A|nr:Hpt domain-containing protein [Jannaschia marina]